MAQPISETELELKVRARRRISGAVVLVVALVVLLPMLLDAEPKQAADEATIRIPAQETAPPFAPAVPPALNELPAVIADVRPSAKGEPANGVAKSAAGAVQPLGKAVQPEKRMADTAEVTETAGRAAQKLGKFAVQIGVFANPENAGQMESRLKENNIRHYTETLKNPVGAIRVRAGPFANRAEAESALTRLKLAGIADGVVVSE